ncbi:MAG: hypothetical protein NZV14_14315 [Bryobacteraceae bacterium]|nr:hypothetical protein [Bryobacteraceae bacterium]MDW8379336.1 hypothetical protein [Bryobacterales bacterium]
MKDPGDASTCNMFSTHPHLSDQINRHLVQSEIEGGVELEDLPVNSTLEIETQNRFYRLVHQGDGKFLISGHPKFCPRPTAVTITGSNWGGSMLKRAYVGRGMHLEFVHPNYDRPIVTSRILEIRLVEP